MTRLRPYLQLVRLPNVFTALADICLGWLVADPRREHGLCFALLLVSSACLYAAGMVWNDFFDLEQDRRERPFRPIPSGQVSRRSAATLGAILLLIGIAAAFAASSGSFVIALVLAGAVLLYDGWLKRTWAGPLGMGTCRFLNVLLGSSVAGAIPAVSWHLASVVGLYIVGVTWFARTEARASARMALGGAAAVMLAALVIALPMPLWGEAGSSSPLFPYLLVGLGFLVGIPIEKALADPEPKPVQLAVKRAIFGLVVLDAVMASALVGVPGLAILLLLAPILLLGRWRWLYAT